LEEPAEELLEWVRVRFGRRPLVGISYDLTVGKERRATNAHFPGFFHLIVRPGRHSPLSVNSPSDSPEEVDTRHGEGTVSARAGMFLKLIYMLDGDD
jgi:hypothetical protein